MFFESKVSLCLAAIERIEADQARNIVETLGLSGPPPDQSGSRKMALSRLQNARIALPVSPDHKLLVLWLLGLEQDSEAEVDHACDLFGVDPADYFRQRPLYLTSDQVRRLAADGFTVGGHGLSHLKLQRMDRDQIEREIVTSCQVVHDLTGQKRVPFAFPYSGQSIDRPFLADLLERHKFIDLFFDMGGIRREVQFIVHRLRADLPTASADGGTNLPLLLRRAWSQPSAWS